MAKYLPPIENVETPMIYAIITPHQYTVMWKKRSPVLSAWKALTQHTIVAAIQGGLKDKDFRKESY